MSNKRKIVDVQTKCRLCLGEEGCMSYLFDGILSQKLENITKCTSIIIKEDDDFPNKICHVCLYKLDTWEEFKEHFIKSNKVLLDLMNPAETDDLNPELYKSKRKQDDSHVRGTENLSATVSTKKVESDVASLQPLEFTSAVDQTMFKDKICISDDEPIVLSSDKEENLLTSKIATIKDEEAEDKKAESKSEDLRPHVKPTLIPMRLKHFGGRRRITAKRRASTKRWVARKKALLAATGKYASDTDSIISDNESKLSPVQKARAKTNADKEAEKQRRLAKELKNLETDMKGEYGIKYANDAILIADTDSDAKKHKTRFQKKNKPDKVLTDKRKNSINSTENETDIEIKNEKKETANEKENKCILGESTLKKQTIKSQSVTQDHNHKKSMDLESVFNPQSIRSELEVDEATYIVTSTLVFSDPHYLKETDIKSFSKNDNSLNIDENSRERNTDIIDAVQLRRINPKSANEKDEKKIVERCLNIEIEGTELKALQKVQSELAAFVEKDMKNRLSHKEMPLTIDKSENKPKDSFQALDNQLKTIVEKAIRKNIEASRLKRNFSVKTSRFRNQKTSTFSPAFVKAAMNSKIFQPKVLLTRLDLNKIAAVYNINNISVIECQKLNKENNGNENAAFNEKQNNFPLNYDTFKLVPKDSDNAVTSDDQVVTSTPNLHKSSLELASEDSKRDELFIKQLSGSKKRKKLSLSQQVVQAIRRQLKEDLNIKRMKKSNCETVECDTTTKTLPLQPANDKSSAKRVKFSEKSEDQHIELAEQNTLKYFCGICDEKFANLSEKEEHIKSHKSALSSELAPKSRKPRMMRCKRCHEVVDARLVRVHTCRSAKFHKCYVCNSTFRSEKMLVCHLETHDESEFNIESIELGQSSKKVSSVTSTQGTVAQNVPDSNTMSTEYLEKKETYTCFVCDKKFTDDEILKDHLQQHCNDLSEDDTSTGKEQYQCAICGDTLDSEDALETHVEKHLCDDQDDNPNLINISNDSDQNKDTEEIFKCSQCTKQFNSEMLLVMHMQAHEEEAAIAEWEKESTEGMKMEEAFLCPTCDEAYDTEEGLAEHLSIHNSSAHVCFLCEKPFLSLEDLQAHVESH